MSIPNIPFILFIPVQTAQSLPGTLMGVMALKTPQATTADHKRGGRWLPKEKTPGYERVMCWERLTFFMGKRVKIEGKRTRKQSKKMRKVGKRMRKQSKKMRKVGKTAGKEGKKMDFPGKKTGKRREKNERKREKI